MCTRACVCVFVVQVHAVQSCRCVQVRRLNSAAVFACVYSVFMCVFICVHVCARMCVCVCVCLLCRCRCMQCSRAGACRYADSTQQLCLHVSMSIVYLYVYLYVCVCVCMYLCMHLCVFLCVCVEDACGGLTVARLLPSCYSGTLAQPLPGNTYPHKYYMLAAKTERAWLLDLSPR